MKTFLPLIILALFFLGSCMETIEIEKLIYDTVYVDKPVRSLVVTQTTVIDTVYRELLRVDTVEVQVVVHDTVVNNIIQHDTVFQIKTDSIFIERVVERIVNHYDTVVVELVVNHTDTIYVDKIVTIHDTITEIQYEQTVVYLATTYLFPGQSVFFIPEPLMPHYRSFIQDAQSRGKSPTGGDLIVQYVKSEELFGEGWVSSSVQMSGWQNVIYLDEGLLPEQSKAAMYRELSRLELRKQYSKDVNKIMSNFFRTSPEPTSQEINQLFL